MTALAVARQHAAHLPPGRRGRALLRMGHRIAAGLAPARAAAAEGLGEDQLDEVLADPAFGEMVAACRRIRAMSDEERLERLAKLALDALEVAMADADPRVMAAFVAMHRTGRSPALILAERVLRQDERARASLARAEAASATSPATTPPADPAPAAPRPTRPRHRARPLDPAGSLLGPGMARLRAALRLEHALHDAGAAPLPGPGGRPPEAVAAMPSPAPATGPKPAARGATPPKPTKPRRPEKPSRRHLSRGGPAKRGRRKRAPP